MTFKELKNKTKKQLKETANTIRILKAARKPHVYNSNPVLYNSMGSLDSHRYNYRHKHIAYCMFFNRTEYEVIEKKCNENPYIGLVDQYKKEWTYIVEANQDGKIVCDSEEGS
jgi:hypothetical protein